MQRRFCSGAEVLQSRCRGAGAEIVQRGRGQKCRDGAEMIVKLSKGGAVQVQRCCKEVKR